MEKWKPGTPKTGHLTRPVMDVLGEMAGHYEGTIVGDEISAAMLRIVDRLYPAKPACESITVDPTIEAQPTTTKGGAK